MDANPIWQEDALCKQTDPDIFFAESGENYIRAERICATCPVRLECLRHALEHNEQWGIWGGCTPNERKHLKGWVKHER